MAADALADAADRGVPWRSRTVQVVLLSTALAPLGVPLISPALPAFRDAFGVTDAAAALLVSTYFLTGIVLSPAIGTAADRYGRRRVLVPSLFVFSLAGASIALGPPFAVVVAVRVVQGTAAAGVFVSTVTLIGDSFEGPRRNAVLGVNTAALTTGAAVYPLVGGVLAGVAWNAPFVVYLVGLPVAVVALVALREPSARSTVTRSFRAALGTIRPRDGLVAYGGTFVTEFLFFGVVVTALPFLLAETYALGPVAIGAVLTVGEAAATVAAAANGRLAMLTTDRRVLAAGFGCYAVGAAGVAWAPSALAVGVAVAIVGAGAGLNLPSVDADLTRRVPGPVRASALSLRNSATFLGRAAGPVVFTALAPRYGYPSLLAGAAVVAAGTALGMAVAARS